MAGERIPEHKPFALGQMGVEELAELNRPGNAMTFVK